MIIERNIPIPIAREKYEFNKLLVGESAIFEAKARTAASVYKSNHDGWDYISTLLPNGKVRIWRTA